MNVDSSHSNDKLFYNQNKPDYYGKFNHFIKMNRLPAVFRKYFTIEQIQNVSKRQIHITGMNFDITWRRDRRLPKNPTSTGPLTDLPDYTFMDGRPTPLGSRMKSRVEQQRELARKIIQGIREVDSAKIEYQRKLRATEEERQSILDSKLKPKGKLLTKKQ